MSPNANNKQNWVNKPLDAPSGHYNVKIAKDVDHYLTMQGFTSIASVDWYTIDFQPSEVPAPIQGLQVLVNSSKKADVYAVKQFVTAQTNNKHQVTTLFLVKVPTGFQVNNYLSYFYRASASGDATTNLLVRGDTYTAGISFTQGGWYLLTNTSIVDGALPPGWIWNNVELKTNTAYHMDKGLIHLIMPLPESTQMCYEMLTSLPRSRAAGYGYDSDNTEYLDAPDFADQLREDIETDTDIESTEDEDDEADRFDIIDTSDEEYENETDRVTLLSTLVNQGMTMTRATRIARRAFPTLTDKIKRGVYMDLLVSGASPNSAWSHACEEARKAAGEINPCTSGSRDHAE
uniref:Mamastrovirus 1 capsid protein n=1 Tax=Mamastrovirus 1 TaxID=1239565 RepID=A0A0C6E016_9VIRU|nr:capsid protein [Mamastrovirus 1]